MLVGCDPKHSKPPHVGPAPEPGEFEIYGILDPREFVERLPRLQENLSEQEKTLLNTTGERVLKKENSK